VIGVRRPAGGVCRRKWRAFREDRTTWCTSADGRVDVRLEKTEDFATEDEIDGGYPSALKDDADLQRPAGTVRESSRRTTPARTTLARSSAELPPSSQRNKTNLRNS